MKPQTAITIDTSDLEQYIARLKKKTYKGMISDVKAVVRQTANDMKRAYLPFVPESNKKGGSGKYGFTSGNLKRSLGIYPKRMRDAMTVEFSVGFKKHRYGELAAKLAKGKKATDGYYGAWVNAGVAGRQQGRSKTRSNVSQGFRERAVPRVNRVMKQGISERGMRVIKRRLEKDILANI